MTKLHQNELSQVFAGNTKKSKEKRQLEERIEFIHNLELVHDSAFRLGWHLGNRVNHHLLGGKLKPNDHPNAVPSPFFAPLPSWPIGDPRNDK